MAKAKKPRKPQCRDLEMDLTDYVLGETTFLTGEKQKKLFEHLRTCKECREQFWTWKDTLALLKGKAWAERPGTKERLEKLLAELRKQPCATHPKTEIIQAADKIYNHLKVKGKTAIPELREETGLVDYPFYEALGLLTVNEKIDISKNKGNRPVYAEPYQPELIN